MLGGGRRSVGRGSWGRGSGGISTGERYNWGGGAGINTGVEWLDTRASVGERVRNYF